MTRRMRAATSWIVFGLAVSLGCSTLVASEEKQPPAPAVGDVSATSKTTEPSEGSKAAQRLGLDLTSDAPLEINSSSFEMLEEGKGGERFRFRGNVKLKQGELELRCDRLDAFFPEGRGGGRPQSLVASGDVQVVKGEFELQCTRATFEEKSCIAVCLSSESCKSGKWPEQPARFKRGKDWIEGRELEFNQCTGKLFARCGARLQVAPQEKDKDKPAEEKATEEKPVVAPSPPAAEPGGASEPTKP